MLLAPVCFAPLPQQPVLSLGPWRMSGLILRGVGAGCAGERCHTPADLVTLLRIAPNLQCSKSFRSLATYVGISSSWHLVHE